MLKLLLVLSLKNLLPSELKQELTGRFQSFSALSNSLFLGAKTSRSLRLCKITLLPLHFFFPSLCQHLVKSWRLLMTLILWNGCAYICERLTRLGLIFACIGQCANTAVHCHFPPITQHWTMKIAWLHGRHFFPGGGAGELVRGWQECRGVKTSTILFCTWEKIPLQVRKHNFIAKRFF